MYSTTHRSSCKTYPRFRCLSFCKLLICVGRSSIWLLNMLRTSKFFSSEILAGTAGKHRQTKRNKHSHQLEDSSPSPRDQHLIIMTCGPRQLVRCKASVYQLSLYLRGYCFRSKKRYGYRKVQHSLFAISSCLSSNICVWSMTY